MIPSSWLDSLRLENRKAPELLLPADDLKGIPHSAIIRQSFDELNLAAIHCISGVPTIAFLVLDQFEQDKVDRIHKALWNQGFATLLLVITDDVLRAYSLVQIPSADINPTEKLIQTLSILGDALELKDLVLGVESGRFIAENEDKFNSNHRVDKVLLGNLESTVNELIKHDMTFESAQALLMQIMFIAYLEDKEIINAEYFQEATKDNEIDSLKSLLSKGCPEKFAKLFELLKEHFNGDMFVAPCSFDVSGQCENLSRNHIKIISDFRSGNINLISGQYRLWPYDFKFIPIDLISAVYDRFLGFDPIKKRATGAYYTPMFLADLVTEQAWFELSDQQRGNGKYVDPSCGSGIFLVRLFEKMIDEWKISHQKKHPTWPALLAMLRRLHGFDIKKESIHVAAFSLYIALLENTRPAEILALMKKGRLLPKLYGETLKIVDFFDVPAEENKYDLIIGNPPWVSRSESSKSAEVWCKKNQYEMPAKEIAWGFAWKALTHTTNKNSVVALLLKATSFLTNHSPTFVSTRRQWMSSIKLIRVVNFADTRFQLFEGGSAPTALMIYRLGNDTRDNYKFDYWVPKADLNLKTKRLMTLSSIDQARLPIKFVIEDQLLMKRRMWMQTPDAKLYQYLSNLSKLAEKLITYKESKKKINSDNNKWIIGQGFIPTQDHKLGDLSYKTSSSEIITKIPHLKTQLFKPLVTPTILDEVWPSDVVYRKGFEEGFSAPHILIPQGIERKEGRLRASYCTQDLSFRDSIQSISFKKEDERQAKFLTILLNSSLIAWFLFHHSSNTGMERDKVHQEQLLDIPFPLLENTVNQLKSKRALDQAAKLIDQLLAEKDDVLKTKASEYMNEIDKIVYNYFGLNDSEILLIEDTLEHIIPSMQPRAEPKTIPSLWENTNRQDWRYYSKWLSLGLSEWLEKPRRAVVELNGASADLVIIGIHLTEDPKRRYFRNSDSISIDQLLPKVWNLLPQGMPGNFQLIPDLRVFIDDVLYIVKPRKRRFWLGSTALADADAIASDLLAMKS